MTDNRQQKPSFFNRDDLVELLLRNGLVDAKNVYLEPGVTQILIELAQNFVEETLDLYKYKKRELNVQDIRKSISLKFPEVSTEYKNENHIVLQNRSKQMDEIDERVKEIEKKR